MFSIKRLTRDDLFQLALLYKELSDKGTDMEKMQDIFEKINSDSQYLLVGVKNSDGELVGSILAVVCHDVLGECRPFMVIDNVIVKSGFRGLGIGKKLIEYVEAFAKEKNCYSISFVSSCRRKESHKFYAAQGYATDFVQGFKKYL